MVFVLSAQLTLFIALVIIIVIIIHIIARKILERIQFRKKRWKDWKIVSSWADLGSEPLAQNSLCPIYMQATKSNWIQMEKANLVMSISFAFSRRRNATKRNGTTRNKTGWPRIVFKSFTPERQNRLEPFTRKTGDRAGVSTCWLGARAGSNTLLGVDTCWWSKGLGISRKI